MHMLKKRRIKKLALAHTALAITLFIVYIALSVTYSPEFFFSDIKNKFSTLAANTINVTASVLAPPIKPTVSISGVCNSGIFKVRLFWPSDKNSTYFDIYRNDLPLATGLSSNTYSDRNTEPNRTYTYMVTAHGPMGPGFENSNLMSITSTDCGPVSESPIITLSPLKSNEPTYVVSQEAKPLFSGSTSIPYAIIDIEVHSEMIVYTQIQANANGYWSWTPSLDIPTGKHTLYVSARDPLNPSNTISSQLPFVIISTLNSSTKSSNSLDNNVSKKVSTSSPIEYPTTNKEEFVKIPLAYDINFQQNSFRQGEEIKLNISIKAIEKKYEDSLTEFTYKIFDQEENNIFTGKNFITPSFGKNIEKSISLPIYLKDGTYSLKTILTFDSFMIENERFFQITPNRFLNFGGNVSTTYPDFLSTMGTISMISMLLLFIWIFFFYREYWLYIHSTKNITEKTLEKFGMISANKGKEVSR